MEFAAVCQDTFFLVWVKCEPVCERLWASVETLLFIQGEKTDIGFDRHPQMFSTPPKSTLG